LVNLCSSVAAFVLGFLKLGCVRGSEHKSARKVTELGVFYFLPEKARFHKSMQVLLHQRQCKEWPRHRKRTDSKKRPFLGVLGRK